MGFNPLNKNEEVFCKVCEALENCLKVQPHGISSLHEMNRDSH